MQAESTTATPQNPLTSQLPLLVRELLHARGVVDDVAIQSFLYPNYDTDLADPYRLSDMDSAVTRLTQAISKGEKVAVYGDYDIDGIVSTALMAEVLQLHGLEPLTYIPDRYDEGYGIHIGALEELKSQGVSLVISVDCGITSIAEATWAKQNGLDLIITDHHDPEDEIPEAVAVVNPKRFGDDYPFKELAGVGVVFAVVRALQRRTGLPISGHEKWLLDLVAMGTVCDVMPLIGENRVLVSFGLQVLRKTRRVGLVALAQSADIELGELRSHHLGFGLGPRLNAAGRLEHANYSLELVTTKDPIEAQALAFQLEELNHQRQLEQERITQEASALAEMYTSDPVLLLADPGWSHGVVGIVASKLAERYGKPTLILQIMGDSAKGSGRSANGYSLIDGLRAHQNLFTKVGGHDFAAGFTLPTDHIGQLRIDLNNHYREAAADLPAQTGRHIDLKIEDTRDIGWDFYNSMKMLEPFGNGNMQPCFAIDGMKVVSVDGVGKQKQHLKVKLADPHGGVFEAIGFGLAEQYPGLRKGQTVNIQCYIQKNQWQDRVSLQFGLLAIQ